MKRVKNKKALSTIVIGAAVLSVGSVGFASWVISGGESSRELDSIGVNLAEVSDQRVTVDGLQWINTFRASQRTSTGAAPTGMNTLISDSGDAQICFGPSINDTNGVIQASGTKVDDLEHLKLQFGFTVSAKDLRYLDTLSLDFTFPTPETIPSGKKDWGSALDACAASDYIVNPWFSTKTGISICSGLPTANTVYPSGISTPIQFTCKSVTGTAGEGQVASFEALVLWNWGGAFGGKNPSVRVDESGVAFDSVYNSIVDMNSELAKGVGSMSLTVKATGRTTLPNYQ